MPYVSASANPSEPPTDHPQTKNSTFTAQIAQKLRSSSLFMVALGDPARRATAATQRSYLSRLGRITSQLTSCSRGRRGVISVLWQSRYADLSRGSIEMLRASMVILIAFTLVATPQAVTFAA